MPERSFGRTIKSRRTSMGLSQAKLGELVGRSASTIRSWERDRTLPSDSKVIAALAAVLAIDEQQLLARAGVETADSVPDATIEQALATLAPDAEEQPTGSKAPESAASSEPEQELGVADTPVPNGGGPYVVRRVTPRGSDTSYIEDKEQRQVYRVRMLATFVAVVALIVAFVWAIGEGWGAFSGWWDDFFGNLRL